MLATWNTSKPCEIEIVVRGRSCTLTPASAVWARRGVFIHLDTQGTLREQKHTNTTNTETILYDRLQMCVYLSFRYCMGQPSKEWLYCQHTFACDNILACGHKIYQFIQVKISILRQCMDCLGFVVQKNGKWMDVGVKKYQCVCLFDCTGRSLSVLHKFHTAVTLRTGPLRVQKHFNNAYMPTLHVMHQPNLLMPPNKFHCCTAGNVQSHSCVGRWVILKLFLRFHFITPQCHLYVLLYNMWFIKESIPGSCRNNIREMGRNQRSLCFLSGVLTVIPMCPLRGKSYSTWAPHNTNNSLFDLRWKSSAWFKAVFFKDIDG